MSKSSLADASNEHENIIFAARREVDYCSNKETRTSRRKESDFTIDACVVELSRKMRSYGD